MVVFPKGANFTPQRGLKVGDQRQLIEQRDCGTESQTSWYHSVCLRDLCITISFTCGSEVRLSHVKRCERRNLHPCENFASLIDILLIL